MTPLLSSPLALSALPARLQLMFYISVIVLLLNIVFGIVIDTFAQQREMQIQIKDNMDNVN